MCLGVAHFSAAIQGRAEVRKNNCKGSPMAFGLPRPFCRATRRRGSCCRLAWLLLGGLAAAAIVPASLPAQEAIVTATKAHAEGGVPEQEVIYEALASYGNYKVLAGGTDCKLYTSGVEYDRHSWGRFLWGDLDYVGEALPVIVLNEPQRATKYGYPIDPKKKQLLYGMGFSPIGWRLQWRSERRIKPYLEMKGGVLVFDKKALSREAAYENFSLQYGLGTQVRLTPRVGLRLGLFTDFHFSDGFVVPANPGLDVMTANLGISYHLGQGSRR